MNSVIIAIVAVLPGVVLIAILLASERNLKKKNANQRFCLEAYGERIRSLEWQIDREHDLSVTLLNEINYHLHGGRHDIICDAAREWRDGDISGAYTTRIASISGSSCRYCHVLLLPGEFVCSHCGATMLDIESLHIWGGK